ncbi:MAG: transglycosylase domain-containing protein, partial [Acidimicrobiia bacterium]
MVRKTWIALAALLVGLAGCSYEQRSVLPPIPVNAQSSTIYASDGTLLTTFHAEENRRNVSLSEMPGHLRDAVIAIEDERFYLHDGVDFRAVLRAVRTNAEAGGIQQGGSTITQQYVKTALLKDPSQTLERKLEEASMALQLERQYSKDRILELYLNTIYFGNGAYGVDAASRQYFGRPVGELTLDQSSLLAGLIQRPSATDPYRAPDLAVARRSLVLDRMVANGFVDQATADATRVAPLQLASEVVPAAERYPAAYFVETVKRWILDDPRFGATPLERRDLLFGGGLRIQTTVDLDLQAKAEAAVAARLPDPTTQPAASLVSIEPATGFVRAMVGGRDFFGTDPNAKFNLATQGPRQAGSSFKPFVLAAALAQGADPYAPRDAPACKDIPLPHDQNWHVCNYGGGGGGTTNLVEGTIRSYNTLYADLILQ